MFIYQSSAYQAYYEEKNRNYQFLKYGKSNRTIVFQLNFSNNSAFVLRFAARTQNSESLAVTQKRHALIKRQK